MVVVWKEVAVAWVLLALDGLEHFDIECCNSVVERMDCGMAVPVYHQLP